MSEVDKLGRNCETGLQRTIHILWSGLKWPLIALAICASLMYLFVLPYARIVIRNHPQTIVANSKDSSVSVPHESEQWQAHLARCRSRGGNELDCPNNLTSVQH